MLEADVQVPVLGYTDVFVFLADSPAGLQHLIYAVVASFDAVGMIIRAVKTQTLVFSSHPVPAPPWHCQVVVLQQVEKFNYLATTFSATRGTQATFQGF